MSAFGATLAPPRNKVKFFDYFFLPPSERRKITTQMGTPPTPLYDSYFS
jgi:hypothetical protein